MDLSADLQKHCERHLELCHAWSDYHESEEDDYLPSEPDPSMAPYDGCLTCVVREVLYAASSFAPTRPEPLRSVPAFPIPQREADDQEWWGR